MKDRIVEHYRPNTITSDLITNEDEINRIKESEKTNWDYVFADSADDENTDKEVRFRMRDADTPATYETEAAYYDPTTIQIETEITGRKIWLKDTLANRPEVISVYLFSDGAKVKEQTVTARNNWTYRFTNIPLYDAVGEKIVYTVKEKPIPGYKTTYENYNIINTRVESSKDGDIDKKENVITTSRATRIGIFILGAAAITVGLLLDQVRKEE